ncbi:MAG: DNA-3-methyladenine glycosylase 2 family protein [Pseudomonadota bacterium]
MKLNREIMPKAHRHLRRVDPLLAEHLPRLRRCDLHLGNTPLFASLATAIVGQQLSTAAARTIQGRVEMATGSKPMRFDAILKTDEESLRSAGLSRSKTRYLKGLATAVDDGVLNFRSLARQSDALIIERLTTLPGIGEWTAQMFLMFGLKRADVAAPGDLGLLKGMQALDNLEEKPSAEAFLKRSECWRPFRSVACWYLWRLIE